jgi:ribosomal protein S13
MLKKNNIVSLKTFFEPGANKKTIANIYKKLGINLKQSSFFLKNSQIIRIKNLLNKKLVGKNLKKRLDQLKRLY